MDFTYIFKATTQLNSDIEYGVVNLGIIADTNTKDFTVAFSKAHTTRPITIIMSYETYGYFYGTCHTSNKNAISNTGFSGTLIPLQIGNGQGTWRVHWIALW